jgi:hypothetical protein
MTPESPFPQQVGIPRIVSALAAGIGVWLLFCLPSALADALEVGVTGPGVVVVWAVGLVAIAETIAAVLRVSRGGVADRIAGYAFAAGAVGGWLVISGPGARAGAVAVLSAAWVVATRAGLRPQWAEPETPVSGRRIAGAVAVAVVFAVPVVLAAVVVVAAGICSGLRECTVNTPGCPLMPVDRYGTEILLGLAGALAAAVTGAVALVLRRATRLRTLLLSGVVLAVGSVAVPIATRHLSAGQWLTIAGTLAWFVVWMVCTRWVLNGTNERCQAPSQICDGA